MVTLDLTIIQNITYEYVANQNGIVVNAPNASSYQWLDCDNNLAEIPREGFYVFDNQVNGNYAVIIGYSNCSDTSECIALTNVGLQNEIINDLVLYPNPTNYFVHISTDAAIENISVVNLQGRLVLLPCESGSNVLNVELLETGKYFIQFEINQLKQCCSLKSNF